jgi:predicted dehydrogenase
MPKVAFADEPYAITELLENTAKKTTGELIGHQTAPIAKVRVGIIGLGNRGKVLLKMFQWLVENDHAEIIAFSDLLDKNIKEAEGILTNWQQKKASIYSKNENDWQNLAKRDDVDLLLICTPWRWHTPMAVFGMEHNKHVACEVPIAYTLEDSWAIVQTAERTKKHCIMIENCCYNQEEMFVLNMAENGVFGDLTHAEGAYLHDLRAHMLSQDYYQDQWRIKHHIARDGNFYTTHGLGPISFYMNIGRGDTFSHVTSMSSRELNLSETAKRENSPYHNVKCGDMNTTLLKTAKGKSIMLQFDVHTGRPYSRINKLVGTKATHDGYPSRLYIDDGKLLYWGHNWLDDAAYQSYKATYAHPIIKKLNSISQSYKEGHGGMDFVMIYRLIRCLNLGLPLDINVYDSAMWSAVTPISELSVASKSSSIPFPDFTHGAWKKDRTLEIMQHTAI